MRIRSHQEIKWLMFRFHHCAVENYFTRTKLVSLKFKSYFQQLLIVVLYFQLCLPGQINKILGFLQTQFHASDTKCRVAGTEVTCATKSTTVGPAVGNKDKHTTALYMDYVIQALLYYGLCTIVILS